MCAVYNAVWLSVDGRVIVTSPMDPLFLLLPYVIKAANVSELCRWFNCQFLCTKLRGSFHKSATELHHFVNFQNIKNPRYTFCKEFNSDYLPADNFRQSQQFRWYLLDGRDCQCIVLCIV